MAIPKGVADLVSGEKITPLAIPPQNPQMHAPRPCMHAGFRI